LSPISPVRIDNLAFLKDQCFFPQKRLLRIFPEKLKNFYALELEFILNKEIEQYLRDYKFILFDILYKSDKNLKKINYHSLVVSNNLWTNFKIVQATDLHLALRNDELFEKISEDYKQNSPELSKKQIFGKIDDLRKRIVNPNDLLRNFIKLMNQRVYRNDLDFIFITGDIVDFTVSNQHNPGESDIFSYDKSNWKVFKEIILNLANENPDSEELVCPIFTIIGNHDYKPWQYDLNWLGIYKKVGLLKPEAKVLKDEYSASPIKAILKSDNSLNAYLLEINPMLDYFLNLGNFLFIFLNSGSDSYKEITDYLTGSPSLTGISLRQISFLKNLKSSYPNKTSILCIHGPPINSPLKRGFLNRVKKLFKRDIFTTIDEFKESIFKNLKDKMNKARIDNKFNMEYGTISLNWENLLNFCYENCILTISGHTHILNEYRLLKVADSEKNGSKSSIAIFYDYYSKICNSKQKILKFKPFIVQTPALGFKSYKKPGKVGGYREINIKNSNLVSFQVKYL
jgi:predicted MPP superfamily phosphohydrolase